jgi:hypothetical protein
MESTAICIEEYGKAQHVVAQEKRSQRAWEDGRFSSSPDFSLQRNTLGVA